MIFYIQWQALPLNAMHQKRVAYLVLTKSLQKVTVSALNGKTLKIYNKIHL
jgi:hypothetical protein